MRTRCLPLLQWLGKAIGRSQADGTVIFLELVPRMPDIQHFQNFSLKGFPEDGPVSVHS